MAELALFSGPLQQEIIWIMRILFYILCPLLFLSNDSYAGFFTQYSLGYDSDEDTASNSTFTYGRMQNMIYVGATIGANQKLVLGWNFYLWNRSQKAGTGTTKEVSLTELGPRLTYFFNMERNFYLSTAYHPYARGTITGTQTEEVSGSGYLASIGYQHKASKQIYIGASLNYQATSIDKSTVSQTESTVSYEYNMIYPLIEVSFRFK